MATYLKSAPTRAALIAEARFAESSHTLIATHIAPEGQTSWIAELIDDRVVRYSYDPGDEVVSHTLAEKLLAALEILGDTPDKVAAHLLQAGCRGSRSSMESCPVARWLDRVDGFDAGLSSIMPNVEVYDGVPLPPAVDLFVRAFDAGEYPELVAA